LLAPNWNEVLKVGWERNLLIKNLILEAFALARLAFPNDHIIGNVSILWEMMGSFL
jgi:hypothetical protein